MPGVAPGFFGLPQDAFPGKFGRRWVIAANAAGAFEFQFLRGIDIAYYLLVSGGSSGGAPGNATNQNASGGGAGGGLRWGSIIKPYGLLSGTIGAGGTANLGLAGSPGGTSTLIYQGATIATATGGAGGGAGTNTAVGAGGLASTHAGYDGQTPLAGFTRAGGVGGGGWWSNPGAGGVQENSGVAGGGIGAGGGGAGANTNNAVTAGGAGSPGGLILFW